MARRGERFNGKQVKCNACGTTAVGTENSLHRRCSGQPDQPPRAKRAERLPRHSRGTWVIDTDPPSLRD